MEIPESTYLPLLNAKPFRILHASFSFILSLILTYKFEFVEEAMHQKRLGDIASYINGYAFKPEQRGKVGLPIIRIQD